ncbi:non-hydrolyzing UDP-N-acetylglucosamine 2-epimerase [Aneurinibacillus sp. REN35]|uniref:non-hydrolyzing UDP-N-acetylglucosamine 2-epimerase n=1 Tax=Aneurinibacillus sp. REN35 TaxID=3237286 RepID=UPI0035287440
MKVMTILGTRPEIIRLSLLIQKLDTLAGRHILVHTGQNYDRSLSDLFFDEMKIRKPDHHIQLAGHSFGTQVAGMFGEVERLLQQEKPDRLLVLGDTNSALCAVIGERMGIPVYHMEAGNRCYDTTVPEEINRKIIDSVASYNLPYTKLSRENLLREGAVPTRIWVSGNPIYEVMEHYKSEIDGRDVLTRLGLSKGDYVVVTAHRAENVDREERLRSIMDGLRRTAEQLSLPVLCSVHPRTRSRLASFGMNAIHPSVRLCEPFGFFDFVHLQKHARCVITDSGTVQEESCLLGVPAVTIRRSTERPETILCGSNILSGLDAANIAHCVETMIHSRHTWEAPEGYRDPHVSTKVAQFVLGGLHYV